MPLSLLASKDDDQRRLDRVLRIALPGLPLSAIYRMFRRGKITVNGKKVKQDDRVKAGDTIEIRSPELEIQQGKNIGIQKNPEKDSNKDAAAKNTRHNYSIEDLIIFMGGGILVLNKPAGVIVHGQDSLQDLVRGYLEPRIEPSLSFKPGPLHRLDKETSGLIVFSTGLEGARGFSAMLREQKVRKFYLAVADSKITADEIWEDELARDMSLKKTLPAVNSAGIGSGAQGVGGGKVIGGGTAPAYLGRAVTKIKPLAFSARHTLVRAEIVTGFTHQIRAQATIHGHPLSGDRKYSGAPLPAGIGRGFLLHAGRLELGDNTLPGIPQKFTAPLPQKFSRVVKILFPDFDIYESLWGTLSANPFKIDGIF
ncbi:MAG: RluA family pseudouridine synthase [Treponema sp.]|nr:RluA family pseudouridine synthase [Treponema sp.]